MEFLALENPPPKNSYFLTTTKSFFHRYCNSEFRTKWTGFWLYERKFLEYFAVKINNNWLSPKNCKKFVKGDGFVTHFYELESFSVKETIVAKDETLYVSEIIENKSENKKELVFELEIAFNIREREENWHNRTYSVRELDDKILISSEKGSICMRSFPKLSFQFIPTYKDHNPIGGLQRCFIPGNFVFRGIIPPQGKKELLFTISAGNSESEAIISSEEIITKISKKSEVCKTCPSFFRSSNETINTLWEIASKRLKESYFESENIKGFIAGLPWFNQVWGRDAGIIISGAVDLGYFREARNSLETLMKFSRNGEIPNAIHFDGRVEFGSIDATPLFLVSFSKYVKVSGDLDFFKANIDVINKSLNWLSELENDDGLIEKRGYKSWMDTLDREYPIEVQVIYKKGLEEIASLFEIIGDKEKCNQLLSKAKKLERSIIQKYWNKDEKYFEDSLRKDIKSINPIFLPFFNFNYKRNQVIKKIKEEFLANFGISTISKNDEKYNPNSYHLGSSWFFINNFYLFSLFKENLYKDAIRLIDVLYNFAFEHSIASFPEAWNPENGSIMLEKPLGKEECALSQTWSYSTFVETIERGLIGIEVNALKNLIIIDPKIPLNFSVERAKRVGNEILRIFVENKDGKIETKVLGSKRKKFRVIVKRGV